MQTDQVGLHKPLADGAGHTLHKATLSGRLPLDGAPSHSTIDVCIIEKSISRIIFRGGPNRKPSDFPWPERMGNVGHVPLISVVDDDESIRVATKALLRSLGWAVHTFASAEDFLHSPHVNDTSCLVVDVQMPGMSGIELQRVLTAWGHSTPTIFITAFPENRIRVQLLEAGAVCFLSKPFDEQSLIGCLDRALKSNGGAGTAQ
jgi:CheY-like chemotaxis protein